MTNRGNGNRNDWSNLNCGHEKESFKEHRERMKAFRSSHRHDQEAGHRQGDPFDKHPDRMKVFLESLASYLKVKVFRRRLITTLWPQLIIDNMSETGGSGSPGRTVDWSALVPTGKVTDNWFSPN